MIGLTLSAKTLGQGEDWVGQYDQQTTIATKTGLNVKHVPGIVDVIYGDSLRKRGLRTVKDAISRLPGIQLHYTPSSADPNFRGNISDPFQGDIQILVNGVSLVSGNDAQPYIALEMPLSLIDRIEVIKGPGSAIYGDFAVNGVINIITVQEKKGGALYAQAGAFDTSVYSVSQRWQNAAASGDACYVTLGLSHARSDGPKLVVSSDGLVNSPDGAQPQASNTPGKADTRSHFEGAFLQAKYRSTMVDIAIASSLQGDRFGALQWLTDGDEYRTELDTLSAQLEQSLLAEQNSQLKILLGIQEYDFTRRYEYLPENLFLPLPGGMGFSQLTEDIYVEQRAAIQRSFGKLQWLINLHDKHQVLTELQVQDYRVRETETLWNIDEDASSSMGEFFPIIVPEPRPVEDISQALWQLEGLNRTIYSLILQDEWQWSPQTRLTIGARYDAFSQREDAFSPRIALVHEVSEERLLKIQLAQAYRPPTLNQESTNPELRNEESIAADLSYSYSLGRWTLVHTAYINWLNNKIVPSWVFVPLEDREFDDITTGSYRNVDERYEYFGFESTVRTQLFNRLQLELNVAATQGDGPSIQSTEQFISPFTADISLSLHINRYIDGYLEQRYFSSRDRRPDDDRAEFGSQFMTNIALAINPLGDDRASLVLAIENAFNEDFRAPAGWLGVRAFPEDFPAMPRRFNASLQYKW